MAGSEIPQMLFETLTPLGFYVRTSVDYWRRLLQKHPDLHGRETEIAEVVFAPEVIRRSRRDREVLLFYRRMVAYWLVAVVRRLNGDGFLVTAYRADRIKEGELVWPK